MKLLHSVLGCRLDTLFICFSDILFRVSSLNCPIFPLLFHGINKKQTIRNVPVMLQMIVMIPQLVPGNLHLRMKIHWTLSPLYIGEEFMKKQPSKWRENQGVLNGLVRYRCQNSCQMLAYPKSKENLSWIFIHLRRHENHCLPKDDSPWDSGQRSPKLRNICVSAW